MGRVFRAILNRLIDAAMRVQFQIHFCLARIGARRFARQSGFCALQLFLFADEGALPLQIIQTVLVGGFNGRQSLQLAGLIIDINEGGI